MSRDSGPVYISEADARAVVQAQYRQFTLGTSGELIPTMRYCLGDTLVAIALPGDGPDKYWRIEWKIDPRALRADRESAEPTYVSMEDAVRELDGADAAAHVTIATRRTVNRMRAAILTRREMDRQNDLDINGQTTRNA